MSEADGTATRPGMRVAVTGGSGRLGRAVVRDLVEHGYPVVNLDRVPPAADAPGDFLLVDLADYGQTLQALTRIEDRYDRVDAVVHLAAVPAPGLVPNTTTFVGNITASHHVFAAARAAGIRSVVWASSETVLGLPFDTPPPYAPVDEGYHPRPESSYSLAKTLEEEMAAQLCRWDPGLKMIGLRFSNVMQPKDYAAFPPYDADRCYGSGPVGLHRRPRRRAGVPALGYQPRHTWRDEMLPDGGA